MNIKRLFQLSLVALLAVQAFADDRFFARAVEAGKSREAGYISNMTDTMPQFVHGGGDVGKWFTSITLVNFRPAAVSVPVNFYADGGAPLEVPVVGRGRVSSLNLDIPAGGTVTIATDQDSTDPLTTGFARITVPCPSASECGDIGGSAVFTQKVPGRPDFESVVPLLSSLAGKYVVPFDNTTGFATGIAIATPKFNAAETADRTVRVVAKSEAGAVVFDQNVTMKANGHDFYDLATRFPQLAGARGTLEFSTQDFVVVLGLRFNSTGAFTALPPYER